MLQLLLLQSRRFEDDVVVVDRSEDVAGSQLFLKFFAIGQHRRRKDGSVRPDGGRVGRVGRPGDDETNVVSGSAKDRGNAFAADPLQPVLVDLENER